MTDGGASIRRKWGLLFLRPSLKIRRGFIELGNQGIEIPDHDPAGVHLEKSLRLQTHEVTRDELADSAELTGQFLMSGGELKLDAARGLPASGLREPDEHGDEALADGGEGELFN